MNAAKKLRVFIFLMWYNLLPAQIIPWRALIVYENTIDSTYPLPPNVNMYQAYVASMIDGLNQVYENSGVNIRAEVAGVVWDKAYIQGCAICTLSDIANKGNGMGRWTNDSILDRYGVDVVMVFNNPNDLSIYGGAALTSDSGYAGYWTRAPDNLYTFAHEAGHLFSTAGNADHCAYGHRRVVDAVGHELGGPAPDTLGFILGTPDGYATYIPDTLIETEIHHAYGGFHTTMAYPSGAGNIETYPCYPQYTDTHLGVTRTFRFNHQGVSWGMPGGNSWEPEWTGTYSNPDVLWLDEITHTYYATGADTISYINRLRYLGATSDTHRDTTTYHRNFSAVLNDNASLLTDLRDIPANIVISSSMSSGNNTADSQWVYEHFSATHSVTIQPGFKFGEGSNLKISVGSPSGILAKLKVDPASRPTRISSAVREYKFHVRYDPSMQAIALSLTPVSGAKILFSVHGLDGKTWKKEYFNSQANEGSFSGGFSIKELPKGIYIVRVIDGEHIFRERIIKW